AWRAGEAVGFELNDILQALGTLLHRSPIGGARHGALQWLQVHGEAAHGAPVPGVERRPDSDLALHRELADRLGALLASTDRPDLAARAPAATVP
ncbi:MAG: hypothetical protein ABIT71_16760, partial [Vicinamibacteraceae bacterium]